MRLHPVYAINNNFLRRVAIIITLPGQLWLAARRVLHEASICWRTKPGLVHEGFANEKKPDGL